MCEFPSSGYNVTPGAYRIQNRANILSNISKIASFYSEASYGQLSLSFTVMPSTYLANREMSYYGASDNYGNELGDTLIREMITKAGVSKGTGAGQYDAVIVLHAGYGNESTSSGGDIWSALYSLTTTNGFTEGMIASELEGSGASPLGVYCHEMGHQLGLPDLYATDGRSNPSRIGGWCLMDMGTWLNNGFNPSHPSAWCKQTLGWATPSSISGAVSSINLVPAETTASLLKLDIPTATDQTKEYFLIEYRSKTAGAFDRSLPGEGVLIWHIDEGTIDGTTLNDRYQMNTVNNYTHSTVDLVPADSSHPMDNNGDSTDPWPGIKNVFSTPDSDPYNGQVSGINSTGFAFASGQVNFYVTQIAASNNVSIDKALNYPNPSGPDYPVNPVKPNGTLTTLVFHFTRAPQDMNVVIYNMAGEKIKSVAREMLLFSAAPSGNYRWVYEYDWNGRNDEGEEVAPGLYFYRVNADGKIKVGKLAVAR